MACARVHLSTYGNIVRVVGVSNRLVVETGRLLNFGWLEENLEYHL
jgi:hypothetical protein